MFRLGQRGSGEGDRSRDKVYPKGGEGVTIHDEINQALEQLAQARQNFDYATPDFIDVAVAELAAAEVRVDLLYRLAKEGAA